ncbi:hypothetical protein SAMN02745215_01838 [Desulfitobacterium chlororespirans DSM 11544]|uniref:Uncharacterized protein n=1 Tax=Desulfitobacterium chlororespirans DSM 11544 TaxID=1121395 RepID=A0A1M7TDE6_9FIRM|nr:hypothetical protein SAMN02745215_01838 [Desulfitobacterium chlororespirans DSM 11544]
MNPLGMKALADDFRLIGLFLFDLYSALHLQKKYGTIKDGAYE